MLFRPCPCIEERREKKRGNGLNALKTRYPIPQICRPTTVCPPRQLAVPYPNGLFIAERRAAKKRGPSQASTPLQKRRATRPQEPRRTGQLVRQYFKTPSPPLFFSQPSHPTVKTNATAAQLEGEKRPFFFQGAFGWRRRRHTHVRTHSCSGDDDTIMVEEEQKGGKIFVKLAGWERGSVLFSRGFGVFCTFFA